MFKSIGKFFKTVAITVFSGACLLAIIYSAYALVILLVLLTIFGIAYITTHWDEVIIWINDD